MLRRPNRVVSRGVEVRAAPSAGKTSFRGISCIAGIAAALSTVACAGGGGSSSMPGGSPVTANANGGSAGSSSNSSSSGNSGTSTGTTTSNSNTSGSTGANSGTSGVTPAATGSTAISVGIPAAAGFGPSPVPAQFATTGGPALSGGISPAPNTVFPALSSSLQVTSNGLLPVTSSAAAITLVSSSTASSTYQISVPSIGVNTTIQMPPLSTSGLSYVALGSWAPPSASGGVSSFTEFAFGYETPPTSLPTTGTASFSGTARGTVFTPGTAFVGTAVNGVAALSVNFGSGNITGAFTQMQYVNPANPGSSTAPNYLPWNDVSVNAMIAAGTNQFSGSTGVTSTPGSPLSLKPSATGYINGLFYGPSAQSIGGIWSLSDGTSSVLGNVGAAR